MTKLPKDALDKALEKLVEDIRKQASVLALEYPTTLPLQDWVVGWSNLATEVEHAVYTDPASLQKKAASAATFAFLFGVAVGTWPLVVESTVTRRSSRLPIDPDDLDDDSD